jgi:hypothetical protein
MQIVSVEQIMPETHNYRKLKGLLKFTSIVRAAKVTDSDLGANGFGRERLVLCLLPQFMEDTSDPPAGRAGRHLSADRTAKALYCKRLYAVTPTSKAQFTPKQPARESPRKSSPFTSKKPNSASIPAGLPSQIGMSLNNLRLERHLGGIS